MADRLVDEHEWRDYRLNQQAQATILARVQFELESHLEEASAQAQHVARYLMDPEGGAVVKVRRLQDSLEALARNVSANGAEASKVAGVDRRLKAVEDQHAAEALAKADRRQWTWRQAIVPFLAVVAALAIERLMAVWWP